MRKTEGYGKKTEWDVHLRSFLKKSVSRARRRFVRSVLRSSQLHEETDSSTVKDHRD